MSNHERYRTAANGLAIIKHFEGFRGKAYKCPAGVWTIGYGSTFGATKDTPEITLAQGEIMLKRDLIVFELGVSRLLAAVPSKAVNQDVADALVAFAYNLGVGALEGSTAYRLLRDGDLHGCAASMLKWNKARAGGKLKELPGLTLRRNAESRLLLSDYAGMASFM
jgi:lysozyme